MAQGGSGPQALSHEQIRKRAKHIWEQRGRPRGMDEQIWLEAETQLKKELGVG